MASRANCDTHCRTIFSSCYFLPLCYSVVFFRQSKHPSLLFVLRHLQYKPLYWSNSDRYSSSIFHFALYTRSASFVTPDRVVLPLTTAQWRLFLFEHKQYCNSCYTVPPTQETEMRIFEGGTTTCASKSLEIYFEYVEISVYLTSSLSFYST